MSFAHNVSKADVMHGVNPEYHVVSSKTVSGQKATVEYTTICGKRIIRYHNTDVVIYHQDGILELNSGGFRTPTTKRRIEQHTNLSVWQEKGVWYVRCLPPSWESHRDAETRPFFDHMTFRLDSQGNAYEFINSPEVPDDERIGALMKRIDTFMRALSKLDILPRPSGADCWVCMAESADPRGNRVDVGHINGHLGGTHDEPEPYIHGTLIVNAMKWAGWTDHAISMHYNGWHRDAWAKQCIKRTVKRYLKWRLSIA